VAGFEDGLSDEAHAPCCQPLEVGLASEARSTTGRWRSRKDDEENEAPCVHIPQIFTKAKMPPCLSVSSVCTLPGHKGKFICTRRF
jgi:hypothetical protein